MNDRLDSMRIKYECMIIFIKKSNDICVVINCVVTNIVVVVQCHR